MNRRRKASNAPRPSAQPKAPVTVSPPAAPAAPATMPSRVSPPPRTAAPSIPASVQPKPVPAPPRSSPQPPAKPSVSPPKPGPAPAPLNQKSAFSTAPKGVPPPAQRRVQTRADLVRIQWRRFSAEWVGPHQAEVEQHLLKLFAEAEKNSRVKGRSLEQGRDNIISSVRREFVTAAVAEWNTRLAKVGLEPEDWADMTPQEMLEVEQVLLCEDTIDPSTLTTPSPPSLSERTTVEADQAPLNAAKAFAARSAQQTAQSASAQKGKPAPTQPSSWFSWGFSRSASVTDVPEEPVKSSSGGPSTSGAILEDARTPSRAGFTPASAKVSSVQPPTQTSAKSPRSVSPPAAQPHGLLTYPVPVSILMAPLDASAGADAEFSKMIDNTFANSIRQFHDQAAEKDAELARSLRQAMPESERSWLIRAHTVKMEQVAREIVGIRDSIITEALRVRNLGDRNKKAADSMPPSKPPAVAFRPPGAFPGASVPENGPEFDWDMGLAQEPEPEPELDADVDEVLDTGSRSKAAKKGKKGKAVATGRSTPTPPVKATTPALKVAPVAVEKTPAPTPVASGWGAASKLAATSNMRSASPAPTSRVPPPPKSVNFAVNSNETTTGTGTLSAGLSPWAAAQAAKAAKAVGVDAPPKPPSPPTAPATPSPASAWTSPPPIQTRTSGGKNAYAPTRPSRLGQVAEPPSPEEPSPPPMRRAAGRDYPAWFAGSSSEDESGRAGDRLSEDEDDEDELDEDASPGSLGGGGLLASLAGASPWAQWTSSQQPKQQEQRGRTASPARGRSTPTPAKVAPARFGNEPTPAMQRGMDGGGWTRWGAPSGASPPSFPSFSGSGSSASPPGFPDFGGSGSFGAPSGFPNPSRGGWNAGMVQPGSSPEDDEFAMLDVATEALNRSGRGAANVEDVMAMYVTAQKARETTATPVPVAVGGGRMGSGWRR
ncbi:uncharacterized protein BXZ73DRAFT_98490 [Epithele typhae]|uniref:uncharacterized protein n=1 Tax=Epithele typhae TaxID=378194 RepID=UPI0020077DAB|nr:uncharacterized protein BXZ73DRAFT_98490 [Epithele typhae]KAH9941273.1 hypothetical protein BXZ73DRAFT_98490 [Epithele typhae]